MNHRRVGLWLIGAFGGVGSTVALGLAALRKGLAQETGLTTAVDLLRRLDLDQPEQFVVGGHDIRRTSFENTLREFQNRANVFSPSLVEPCLGILREWGDNVKSGTIFNAGDAIAKLADPAGTRDEGTPRKVIARIQADIQEFYTKYNLEQVVVINVASTEPPFPLGDVHRNIAHLNAQLERRGGAAVLPASGLYALAALEMGLPYVNFTPSLGASFPAAEDIALARKAPIAGKDGKTGETLLKSVLAPLFAKRNLRILSWVGHNIFGNRDGLVLNDPRNKESKVQAKDRVIADIVGYRPQTHVSIEYIESLDDWKTAWDHVHFEGFLGVKMFLQFIWQGCDSVLAAPLVIDLARLTLLAQRRGESGVLPHLACFFKSPMGCSEQDFFKQYVLLESYARRAAGVADADLADDADQ